jgi:uncharacterized damage-inducible protein DinB
MAIASSIAGADTSFRHNRTMLEKSFAGLNSEEWHKRPGESSNNLLWIVGHIVWARSRALSFLGASWARPWLPVFARGSKPGEEVEYPSPEEVVLAWQDVADTLTAAMETASEDALSAPAPPRSPSFDGTIGGLVSFLAFHETYHLGQAAYLRCWLGHEGVQG